MLVLASEDAIKHSDSIHVDQIFSPSACSRRVSNFTPVSVPALCGYITSPIEAPLLLGYYSFKGDTVYLLRLLPFQKRSIAFTQQPSCARFRGGRNADCAPTVICCYCKFLPTLSSNSNISKTGNMPSIHDRCPHYLAACTLYPIPLASVSCIEIKTFVKHSLLLTSYIIYKDRIVHYPVRSLKHWLHNAKYI